MVVAAICTTVFASCKKDVTPTPVTSSTPLYALITGDTSLSIFNAAVQKAGDAQLFLGTDSVSVLIPTNAAFLLQGISSASISSMSATALDSLVRYHYIAAATGLTTGTYTSFNSLLGPAVYGYGNTDGSNNYFNGSIAIKQSLAGSNATVYKLNTPLQIPASSVTQLLSADTSLSYFAEALNHTGLSLAPSSGWNTVLAPDNNSFIAAGFTTLASIDSASLSTLSGILQYHILPGQYFTNNFTGLSTVNSSENSSINITFNNGVAQFTGTSNTTAAGITQADRIAGTTIIVQKINGLLMP
jgi:uncharacterized surface protein with fasciclin (FAS1) repeats